MSVLLPRLRLAATWSAIALGFALPLSTVASNTLLAMTLLLFLVSGDYRVKFQTIAHNPAALASLGFFAVVLLGCVWGMGDTRDKLHYLSKYASLLAIPLLIPLFADPVHRIRALGAFCAAMLLVLLLSMLMWLEWLPAELVTLIRRGKEVDPSGLRNAVVFKLSITHGFLMALAAYLLAMAAMRAETPRWRWGLAAFAALAAANVLIMVIGRTGYVVLGVLGMHLLVCRFGRRGLALAIVAGLLVGALAYSGSASFQARADKAVAEASAWQAGKGDQSSIGLRFDYYSNALAIIGDHPLAGVGTGGFAIAYGERIRGTAMAPSNNPHNQYLLTTAQLGLFGLAVLLGFYAIYWRQAGRLAPPFRQIAQGVLLAYLVGNLFNSFMMDFTERTLFAWISGVLLAGWPAPQPSRGEKIAS